MPQTRKAGKVCKGLPLRRKTCRGFKGRRYECPLKLQGKDLEIYVGGVRRTGGWISVNNETLYMNRGKQATRGIWDLETKKPVVRTNDATQTIHIGSTKVVIASCQKYERVKEYLTTQRNI